MVQVHHRTHPPTWLRPTTRTGDRTPEGLLARVTDDVAPEVLGAHERLVAALSGAHPAPLPGVLLLVAPQFAGRRERPAAGLEQTRIKVVNTRRKPHTLLVTDTQTRTHIPAHIHTQKPTRTHAHTGASQTNGFSPVWERMCCLRRHCLSKRRPQPSNSHTMSGRELWCCTCRSSFVAEKYRFLHSSCGQLRKTTPTLHLNKSPPLIVRTSAKRLSQCA